MALGDGLIYVGPDLETEGEDYIAGTVLVCGDHEVQ